MNDEAATTALKEFFETSLRDNTEFDMEQLFTYVGNVSNISLANLGNEMKRLNKKGEIAWEVIPGKDGVYRAVHPINKQATAFGAASGGRRRSSFGKKQKREALAALSSVLVPPVSPALSALYDWLYEQVTGK